MSDGYETSEGVRTQGLTCRYGRFPALVDVSLEVARGEFLALVGPSGAGKTTLLRVIAGLERHYSGLLSIAGRDMAGILARERNIGFVFQNYALFRHMTVAENVAFGLRVRPRARRPDRAAVASRVRELLALVQVPELGQRYPAQLSGGQRQRVALARALAIEPALLLLDEPFGALDPMVRKDIRTWLRDLQKRLEVTSIFVTHDQSEAMEMADRVAILRSGLLEQVDTPDALEHSPANAFVHRFLGESMSFAGTIEGDVWRGDEAGLVPFPVALAPGPAVALVRPHEIALEAGEGATITGSRPAGAYRRYAVDLAGRTVEVLLPAAAPPLVAGSHCRLMLQGAHLFPE